ncbi:hypothetical protein [Ferroacidibacillus organovorans]|uniref:hypothetical protein n=1 Tax=Ferroacidibacillus organovorans TaxID=1765683 RepID=UPI00136667F5|nr:hypothetical protein [Ferroacidibacillus organovorans]
MGKPLFVCPKGHYSILTPALITVSADTIAIRCSVCQEATVLSLLEPNSEDPPTHPR